MTKNLFSARRLAPLVCACIFVLVVTPAGAIQREAEGSASNKSIYENLRRTHDNLNDVEKDLFNKNVVEPVKALAKDKAKQAVKKGWNKLKNSKTLGPAAKKLAKKYGSAAKKITRLAGPAGRIMEAYGTGRTVGEKLNTYVLDPLMSAYYDKKQEELTKKIEREFAEYREQLQLDKKVREMARRQEQQHRELAREEAALERRWQALSNPQSEAAPRPSPDVAGRTALTPTVDPGTQRVGRGENETTGRPEAVRRRAYNRFKAECDRMGGRVERDPSETDVYHCIEEAAEQARADARHRDGGAPEGNEGGGGGGTGQKQEGCEEISITPSDSYYKSWMDMSLHLVRKEIKKVPTQCLPAVCARIDEEWASKYRSSIHHIFETRVYWSKLCGKKYCDGDIYGCGSGELSIN